MAERWKLEFVVKVDGHYWTEFFGTDDPLARQAAIDCARKLQEEKPTSKVEVEKVERFMDERSIIWPTEEDAPFL